MTAPTRPTNPFPTEAVATWGQTINTYEELPYFDEPRDELDEYLSAYPDSLRRYGGAFGIRGGHGSGKTHLAMWLAERAQGFKTLKPEVLYAKADVASLFALYRQLIEELSKERIQRVIHEALQQVAIAYVRRAAATADLAQRITSTSDLPALYAEDNLDPELLFTELLGRLGKTRLPDILPRVLLDVDDPSRGETAYRWLLGETIDPSEDAELARSLRAVAEEKGAESAPADVAAIDMLETLAALYSVAGIPLVLIIDQLEIVFRTDPAHKEALFSVFKKFVEQTGGQNALVIVAGTDEAWDAMPRDVTPRLRTRAPFRAGALDRQDTQRLLDSRTGKDRSFTTDAVGWLHELSGGNPREILRIAHSAFERMNGQLSALTETDLLECAKRTGTLEDRQVLALQQADLVLAQYGDVFTDAAVSPDVVLDRVVNIDKIPRIALAVLRATDKISEVNSARRVAMLRESLVSTWPQAFLVVVSVGYSSSEIESLLGATGAVIRFDETGFPQALQAELLKGMTETRAATAPPADQQTVLKLLKDVQDRLDSIGDRREQEEAEYDRDFMETTRIAAEPRREQREMKTRWEVLSRLDDLEKALAAGEPWQERDIIQSVLVANEAALGLRQLERLGGSYIDLVSQQVVDPLHRSELVTELVNARRAVLGALRRAVLNRSIIDRWLNAPWASTKIAAGVTFVVTYAILWFVDSWRYESFINFLTGQLPNTIIVSVPVAAAFYALVETLSNLRLRRFEEMVHRTNKDLVESSPPSHKNQPPASG